MRDDAQAEVERCCVAVATIGDAVRAGAKVQDDPPDLFGTEYEVRDAQDVPALVRMADQAVVDLSGRTGGARLDRQQCRGNIGPVQADSAVIPAQGPVDEGASAGHIQRHQAPQGITADHCCARPPLFRRIAHVSASS